MSKKPEPTPPTFLDLSDAELMAAMRSELQLTRKALEAASREESRWRQVCALLLRQRSDSMAILSISVLARMREEGLVVERVEDTKRGEVMVRLAKADETAAPLGKVKPAEVSEAPGGGTPCATKMEPPK